MQVDRFCDEKYFLPALSEDYSSSGYQFMRMILKSSHIPPKKRLLVPRSPEKKGTLFIDLDNTLIVSETVPFGEVIDYDRYHFVVEFPSSRYGIIVRLHTTAFLVYCKYILNLELVIFTAATKEYADKVISQIQPPNFFDHVLTSTHCHTLESNSLLFKDLRFHSRDMSNSVLLDDSVYNFAFSPNNAIPIKKFTTNTKKEDDHELLKLTSFLKKVFDSSDVRDFLWKDIGKKIRSMY